MVSQKMYALGANRSVIRDLFEYGLQQAAIVGAENVFDYSIGNPSIPSPPEVNDAIVVHSIEEALEAVKDYNDDDIYVIGGESIYRQMLPLCKVAHITKIDYAYQADAHFPNLDEEGWVITETSDERTYFDLIYEFVKYERKQK